MTFPIKTILQGYALEVLKTLPSADSIKVTRSLFQERTGGAVPTSAHSFVLKVITKNLACECYRLWHYLGDTDFIATHHFGVFIEDNLLGCISFGSPNAKVMNGLYTSETQKGWWEIKRLALSDVLPKNSESKTIGISIRLLQKMENVKGIISYADNGVGHIGTIYKASGFTYKGLTDKKRDFWHNGKIIQRGKVKNLIGEWKPKSQKHLFVKLFPCTTSKKL